MLKSDVYTNNTNAQLGHCIPQLSFVNSYTINTKIIHFHCKSQLRIYFVYVLRCNFHKNDVM